MPRSPMPPTRRPWRRSRSRRAGGSWKGRPRHAMPSPSPPDATRSWSARTRSCTSCAKPCESARASGALDAEVDRLFGLALRAGRRARSWRSGRQRSLADVAPGTGRADDRTAPRSRDPRGRGRADGRASCALRGGAWRVGRHRQPLGGPGACGRSGIRRRARGFRSGRGGRPVRRDRRRPRRAVDHRGHHDRGHHRARAHDRRPVGPDGRSARARRGTWRLVRHRGRPGARRRRSTRPRTRSPTRGPRRSSRTRSGRSSTGRHAATPAPPPTRWFAGPTRSGRRSSRRSGAAADARPGGSRGHRRDDPPPGRATPAAAAGAPGSRRGRRRRAVRPGPVRAVSLDRIVIGSRGSALALAQARLVEAALEDDGRKSRVAIIETEGDRRAPDTAWGEGAFVAAIERALLDGRIDVAVHSAKDVPIDQDERLVIAAYLPRADPRDALVVRTDATARSPRRPRARDARRNGQPATDRVPPRPPARPGRPPAPRQRRHAPPAARGAARPTRSCWRVPASTGSGSVRGSRSGSHPMSCRPRRVRARSPSRSGAPTPGCSAWPPRSTTSGHGPRSRQNVHSSRRPAAAVGRRSVRWPRSAAPRSSSSPGTPARTGR